MSKVSRDNIILFDGDDTLFKKFIVKCNIYFEYGVGSSTQYVINNTKAKIIAVDTDKKWINTIKIPKNKDVRINWVNLGELSKWGRPKSYLFRNQFIDYISIIWRFNYKADIILIDGRFRVACFLYSLMSAKKDSIIIFDDYMNRPHYHVVEEIIPKFEVCGRQAFFKVSKELDFALIKELFNKFIYVFD